MNAPQTRRAVLFVLAGVALLVLKPLYRGPHAELVMSYLGNVSVSFAVYFLGTIAAGRLARPRVFAAASALLAVEGFEITDGFGFMSNVYDPWDLVANVCGVALGLAVDTLTAGSTPSRALRPER